MLTVRVVLIMVALAAPAQAALELNTCAGAYARYMELSQELWTACPRSSQEGPRTPASCGNPACATAISSINDTTLSSMKTGFTACGNLPDSDTTGLKSAAGYVMYVENAYLNSVAAATECGLPASTVKVTPPALNTCEGAFVRFTTFSNACPGPYSPTTKCGNTSCATAISFFNDSTVSSVKAGFTACGNLPGSNTTGLKSFASFATYFNYQNLKSWATQCGHPASTVKVTSPVLDTCDGAFARYMELNDANTCETAISSINDTTLSLMQTGFTACGNLEATKGLAVYATYITYEQLKQKAIFQCRVSASTVKLTPPAPNTCDGAYARYMDVAYACQGSSQATCGKAACETAISYIDDSTVSLMKTGFTACGNLNATKYRAVYATYIDIRQLSSYATSCGLSGSIVKLTPPALNTCDGAHGRFLALISECPTGGPNAATCRNTACATEISSIDDSTLSSMKTGFTACGNLPDSDTPGLKSFAGYASSFNYQYLNSIATQCGHPASTVKVTPPALDTCDGAFARFNMAFANACPGPYSPASCGNTACATAISSIDDSTLSLMKTGFTACGNLPDSDTTGLKSAVVYATYVNYQYLNSVATQCGLPASTVKVTPPATMSTADKAVSPKVVSKLTLAEKLTADQQTSVRSGYAAAAGWLPIENVEMTQDARRAVSYTVTVFVKDSAAATAVMTKLSDTAALKGTLKAAGLPASIADSATIAAPVQYAAQLVSTAKSFATQGAYAPGGFIHAVLCVVTLMASSLGIKKY